MNSSLSNEFRKHNLCMQNFKINFLCTKSHNIYKIFTNKTTSKLYFFLFIIGFNSELLAGDNSVVHAVHIKPSAHITNGLHNALEDSNALTRKLSIDQIRYLGKASRAQILTIGTLLQDDNNEVREAAIYALGDQGEAAKEYAHLLVPLLKHQDINIRYAATSALKNLGAAANDQLSALKDLLKEQNRNDVRVAAAKVLLNLSKTTEVQASTFGALLTASTNKELLSIAIKALGTLGATSDYEAQIVTLLGHSYFNVTFSAFNTLIDKEQALGKKTVISLGALVGHQNSSINTDAIRILGKQGNAAKEQIPVIISQLTNKDNQTRFRAIEALSNLGEIVKDQVHTLNFLLAHEELYVQIAVIEVIANLGLASADHASTLVDILTNKDNVILNNKNSTEIRNSTIRILGKMGNAAKEQIPVLISLLKNENSYIRESAISALKNLGEIAKDQQVLALNSLLHDQEKDAKITATQIIRNLGQASSVQISSLVALVIDGDRDVRKAATRTLYTLGDAAKGQMPIIVNFLKHKNPHVHTSAVKALKDLDGAFKDHSQALGNLLNKKESDKVRIAAINALGRLGELAADQASALGDLLNKKESDKVRIAAINALGHLGESAADQLSALGDLLNNKENNKVRIVAIYALFNIVKSPEDLTQKLQTLLKSAKDIEVRKVALFHIFLIIKKYESLEHFKNLTPQLFTSLFNKDKGEQLSASYALKYLDKLENQAPKLAALLLDNIYDDTPTMIVDNIFQLLINSGPHDVSTMVHILSAAYNEKLKVGEVRLLSHLVGGGDQTSESLINLVGKPAEYAVEREINLICKKKSSAISTIKTLNVALKITIESPKNHRGIQKDITDQIASILNKCSNKFTDSHSLLSNINTDFSTINSPHVALIDGILKKSERYEPPIKGLLLILFGQVTFWIFLLTVYPKSKTIQAIFFWNPWYRKIVGFLYIGPILIWTPFLRNRLFAPFRESLVEEISFSHNTTEDYYDGALVTNKTTGAIETITNAISSIKGQIILEGESGLGKTIFLHRLVRNSNRLTIYLNATQCKLGVIKAIQARTHGIASDTDFLKSLIYCGALDICIDGLNEVSPDTRVAITSFVDEYKGNIIIGTQRIEWVPPNPVKTFVLQPLEKNQIQEFLLSRKNSLNEEHNRLNVKYEDNVTQFLAEVLDKNKDKKSIKAIQSILSNPMDLSVVAHMLCRGLNPDVYRLQSQQFQTMSNDFEAHNNGRKFPLQTFSKKIYMMRLDDDNSWSIPSEDFIPELECMAKHKMVITSQYIQNNNNPIKYWQFRHDKIMDYFIVQTFLGENNDKPLKHIKDPRFRGVYFLLATLMPLKEADILREQLIQHAANTNDHNVCDSFVKILHARQN